MLKWMTLFVVVLILSGCAHHGAVRVKCDGRLRPVNAPIESHEPPVSVLPHDPVDRKSAEPQP